MQLVPEDFALGNSFVWAAKSTKNADFDQYKYSRYGIGCDASGSFSLYRGSGFSKNVIIFGAYISSSVHIDNEKKDILILGKDQTDV